MRLKNKVILSLCATWIAFFCIIYIGTHAYFLNRLLQIQGWQDSQDVIISHYAISHLVNNYLIAFFLLCLLFVVLGWYLLRAMFLSHWRNFKNQLSVIYETSNHVRRIKLDEKDELYFVAKQFNHMMDSIQRLHKDLAGEVEKVNQLCNKISILEQRAAKADRASGVFHKVCDLLNSIATSVYVTRERIGNSKAEKLTDLARLFVEQQDNLGFFMTQDAKGQHVPAYLAMLAKIWVEENKYVLEEFVLLGNNLAEIRNSIKHFDYLS